jgi:hypothetical protein
MYIHPTPNDGTGVHFAGMSPMTDRMHDSSIELAFSTSTTRMLAGNANPCPPAPRVYLLRMCVAVDHLHDVEKDLAGLGWKK